MHAGVSVAMGLTVGVMLLLCDAETEMVREAQEGAVLLALTLRVVQPEALRVPLPQEEGEDELVRQPVPLAVTESVPLRELHVDGEGVLLPDARLAEGSGDALPLGVAGRTDALPQPKSELVGG